MAAERPPTTVEVGVVCLGAHHCQWSVVSDCGVVKVYSSRDDCMLAVNSTTARRVADEFVALMHQAADTTELRSYGEVVSGLHGLRDEMEDAVRRAYCEPVIRPVEGEDPDEVRALTAAKLVGDPDRMRHLSAIQSAGWAVVEAALTAVQGGSNER